MAKRKPDPAIAGQLDMFGDGNVETRTLPNTALPIAKAHANDVQPANDTPPVVIIANDMPVNDGKGLFDAEAPIFEVEAEIKTQLPETSPRIHQSSSSAVWLNDEWWTTAMVCAYLKLGRKAIWERTRHPTIGFPQPTHFGSCRHRWRAGEVKAWAEMR